MIYQKIIWRKLRLTFATMPVLKLSQKNIEGYHRLPASRYIRDSNKRVIVNFVNRKHLESLPRNRKFISSKNFSHLNVHGKVFVSVSLCPYYRISGVSVKTCKEEGKSIKSFALAVLLQLKLPNAAVQGKYFMNVIYLILILMMYKKFKLDFVL